MAYCYILDNHTSRYLGLDPKANMFEIDPHAVRLRRMKDGVMRWAKLAQNFMNSNRCDILFLTLTLKPGIEYCPKMISQFFRAMRNRGILFYGYAWTLELQKRGAVHWHVALLVPKGYRIPKPDLPSGRKRQKLWPYGSSNIQKARIAWGVLTYLAKYLSKGPDSETLYVLPKGSRIYATTFSKKCWKGVKRPVLNRWLSRVLPYWVQKIQGFDFPSHCRAMRNRWGQWAIWDNFQNDLTGGFMLWQSPYQVDA